MDLPIISTKLNIPGLSSHHISRPELRKILDKSREYKLMLLSAPAGFGKSSLVSAWSVGQKKIGWLCLDESDNDPVSFFSHVFYAFNQLDHDLGSTALSALREGDKVNFNTLLSSLVNEISGKEETLYFVLDDYHLIDEEVIHKALQLLLDRMPGQLHLIIITRSDPPFSLSRLRSSEQLCEIRAEELKFDLAETKSFLNDEWLLDIGTHDIRHLYDRMEGWITGLQLSAFSLDKIESKSAFIQSLNGDDRYIADYLAEQVLNNLTEEMKHFILQISILNRLCGSLADAVTGDSGSGELLAEMERENLFLIPLDNKREWFRLHHLFSDLLRQRLTGERWNLQILHSRASDWFDSNGYPIEAIDHAIKSGNSEKIIFLMEKYANDFLMRRGETKNVLKWLKRIPEDLIRSSARLNLTYAWVLFYEFSLPRIQFYLDNLAKLPEMETNADVKAEYETVLATINVLKGEMNQSVERYRFAMQTISSGNYLLRGIILFGLGYGLISIGKLTEAEQILEEAGSANKINGNVSISLKSYCFLAMCRILMGRITEAGKSVAEAFGLVKESGLEGAPIMSLAFSISAELEKEKNNLVEAAEKASKAIDIALKHDDSYRLFTAYIVMTGIKETQRLYSGSLSYLEKAEDLIKGKAAHLSTVRAEAVRKRLLLNMNQSAGDGYEEPDDRWLSLSGAIMIPGQVPEYEHLTYVRYLIVKKEHSEAEALLDRLMARLDSMDCKRSRFEIIFHQMLVQLDKGNKEESRDLFDKLVGYSETEGNPILFLEYAEIVRPLLRETAEADFSIRLSALLKTAGRKQSTPELIIPLSGREREVLHLLDTDMTNMEIAERLFISVNTVKTHIKSINGKLNTANRKEAVLRSRDLGLLR